MEEACGSAPLADCVAHGCSEDRRPPLTNRTLESRLRVRATGAVVLREALLGNPVKCQRRHGALQARGDNAPMALRAAPAGEVLVFSPNHASLHTNTYAWF